MLPIVVLFYAILIFEAICKQSLDDTHKSELMTYYYI